MGYKVVAALESGHTGEQTFFGIRVPKGVYLSWVELVTIQFVHPNASFLGHLCGVLAGWLYYLLFLKQRGRSRVHGQKEAGLALFCTGYCMKNIYLSHLLIAAASHP